MRSLVQSSLENATKRVILDKNTSRGTTVLRKTRRTCHEALEMQHRVGGPEVNKLTHLIPSIQRCQGSNL